MNRRTHYSPHFAKHELLVSETAARLDIDNTPSPEVERNLERLCESMLEPLRARFGPYSISSGYRRPDLNAAIGGSRTSVHPRGLAADGRPLNPDVTLKEVVEFVVASDLPFDQVIYEFGRWVHVGIAPAGRQPRKEALMIFSSTEGYLPWNPTDPRVTA